MGNKQSQPNMNDPFIIEPKFDNYPYANRYRQKKINFNDHPLIIELSKKYPNFDKLKTLLEKYPENTLYNDKYAIHYAYKNKDMNILKLFKNLNNRDQKGRNILHLISEEIQSKFTISI